ncbi:MAG: hypothetical protein B5M51_03025 [Anaerolinea sp. 4484_236]|nr:MAG: hypothetical protein B5M51_03025 [Anaerolinea sp. 4484_236]OQY36029.1 MAG: hypothetical protein B6243_04015 [Anaerolineaceae bacterium 4572_5.2]
MVIRIPEARLHIRVTGRVQGVGFRSFVAQNAKALDLTGWVRNVGRDQVETVAEGRRENLEKFTQTVRMGPSVSDVREMDKEWEEPLGEFEIFKVRWI